MLVFTKTSIYPLLLVRFEKKKKFACSGEQARCIQCINHIADDVTFVTGEAFVINFALYIIRRCNISFSLHL